MYSILISASNFVLGFVFRAQIIKFALFFGLFFVASEFVQFITNTGKIPSIPALSNILGNLPSGVKYFFNVFNIQFGMVTILSAFGVRFLIRRLPFFG